MKFYWKDRIDLEKPFHSLFILCRKNYHEFPAKFKLESCYVKGNWVLKDESLRNE